MMEAVGGRAVLNQPVLPGGLEQSVSANDVGIDERVGAAD